MSYALRQLTGMPVRSFSSTAKNATDDSVWEHICAMDKKKYTMTTAPNGKPYGNLI